MSEPLTADEILPLVARLSPNEKARLLKLLKVHPDAAKAYAASTPGPDEFSGDDDGLSWDAEGWEDIA